MLESKKAQKAHARQRGPGASIGQVEGMVWGAFVSTQKNHKMHTGWRRPIGCLKSQVIFRKRATTYRALLQKMTCKDKVFDGSSPPCRMHTIDKRHLMHLLHPMIFSIVSTECLPLDHGVYEESQLSSRKELQARTLRHICDAALGCMYSYLSATVRLQISAGGGFEWTSWPGSLSRNE